MDKVSTCLWFDRNAEEAARYYVALFPDSRIDRLQRSPTDWPAGKAGDVVMVEFTLAGRSFQALNGGSGTPHTPAMSLSIDCKDQAEVDRYWAALSADPRFEQCSWCRDRFGVHWQIVPEIMPRMLADPDRAKADRVMRAMMGMKKLDVAELERAAAG